MPTYRVTFRNLQTSNNFGTQDVEADGIIDAAARAAGQWLYLHTRAGGTLEGNFHKPNIVVVDSVCELITTTNWQPLYERSK